MNQIFEENSDCLYGLPDDIRHRKDSEYKILAFEIFLSDK